MIHIVRLRWGLAGAHHLNVDGDRDQYASKNSVQLATTAERIIVSFDFLRRMAPTRLFTKGNFAARSLSFVVMPISNDRCPARADNDYVRMRATATKS